MPARTLGLEQGWIVMSHSPKGVDMRQYACKDTVLQRGVDCDVPFRKEGRQYLLAGGLSRYNSIARQTIIDLDRNQALGTTMSTLQTLTILGLQSKFYLA